MRASLSVHNCHTDNSFGDEGVDKLVLALRDMGHVTSLYMRGAYCTYHRTGAFNAVIRLHGTLIGTIVWALAQATASRTKVTPRSWWQPSMPLVNRMLPG